jgi:hypothetical protein
MAWMDADRNPPTAERYAQVMALMDMEDTQPCETARWSGSGPSRRHGAAPRTDTADRTQPHKRARWSGVGPGCGREYMSEQAVHRLGV